MRLDLYPAVILILVVGCSHGPVDPVQIAQTEEQSDSGLFSVDAENIKPAGGHILWGYFLLDFDLENLSVEAVPDRAALSHINIAWLVSSPNCVDCLTFEITEHNPVTRTLKIQVTLRNQFQITGYDIRGILLPKVDGIRLSNADSYTDLWNAGAFSDRNPFRAFSYGVPGRIFPPQYWDYRLFTIKYPSPDALQHIGYAIDASWPENCSEPYEIRLPENTPEFSGANFTLIQVEVLDWQDDIEYVEIYPYPLTMGGYLESMPMLNTSGDDWWVSIVNSNGAHAAPYYLWIKTKSYGSDLIMWNKIRVVVLPDAPPPPPDSTDIQVRYYVARNFDGSMPYYNNPGGGDTEFTYSIAGQQRVWANVLWNKYGFNLVDPGLFTVMADAGNDSKFFYLDSFGEVLEMHQKYGLNYSPESMSMYFVQGLPQGLYTAFCVIPGDVMHLADHNSENIFQVYSPNVWYWEEVMAHESGHAFGSFEDIYLLQPSAGYDCAALHADSPPNFQHLFCDDLAYYEGNLMYFAMGWPIEMYDLTTGQADFVLAFNENYPGNW